VSAVRPSAPASSPSRSLCSSAAPVDHGRSFRFDPQRAGPSVRIEEDGAWELFLLLLLVVCFGLCLMVKVAPTIPVHAPGCVIVLEEDQRAESIALMTVELKPGYLYYWEVG